MRALLVCTNRPVERVAVQPQPLQRMIEETGIIGSNPIFDNAIRDGENNFPVRVIYAHELDRLKPSIDCLLA